MSEDVAEILAQDGRTYAELNSYSDRGYVLSKKHPDEPFEKDITFTTYFKRPNLFRFEWYDFKKYKSGKDLALTPSIIWSDGKNTFANFAFMPKTEKMTSLGMAVASPTGVSGGTAHTIPALLTQEISGRKLTSLESLVALSEESSNGQTFIVLMDSAGKRYY